MHECQLSILVSDTAGILARVAGLFSRRRVAVRSFFAQLTEDRTKFRIVTVVAAAEAASLARLVRQLENLLDVVEVVATTPSPKAASDGGGVSTVWCC